MSRTRGRSTEPMIQQIFQINAFASEPFAGNPALVCPLDDWIGDELLQRIAAESGRTCVFFARSEDCYRLRWFTPKAEIQGICGHGTLAAGFVVLNEFDRRSDEVTFRVPVGELRVRRSEAGGYVLDLPALPPAPHPMPANLSAVLGRDPDAVLGALDLVAVFDAAEHVSELAPVYHSIAGLPLRALITTAPGSDADFVSRWFGPNGEDTGITGSAHCSLIPYWADRLGKTMLRSRQLSPRGGAIDCELHGDRVLLFCTAAKYMQGELYL
jgi:PhzF family phenazine biosynthesis protein